MLEYRFTYTKDDHAAAWTNDYVFHQLIPYIGNKRKLLGLIQQALAKTNNMHSGVFFDAFAGSGVVARMAKKLGYTVIANDWEPYATQINRCYIECNQAPSFAALGGYEAAIAYLNQLPPVEGWITKHLCPTDDQHYNIQTDRLFYTRVNGMRIDAMRAQIEAWEQQNLINQLEKACLLAPMLYQTCYTSNTSGVFKGFHNGWGGKTKTALYRILSTFYLKSALFFDNQRHNRVYQLDATELAALLSKSNELIEIAYLDPPYNQHPYGSNYHVLNTITLWDEPSIPEKIVGRNKAAIRDDWRTLRRSNYNYRETACSAYATLVDTLHANTILTSYSTDGLIPVRLLVETCVRRGATDVVLRSYKRYRVSSQRFSRKPLNVEFVLLTDTRRQHAGPSVDAICEQIRLAETTALSQHSEISNS